MISEKQLEANRRNAQYSTGPRTAEGKAVVAANALRHGFRSQRIVIDGESTADYDDFRNGLVAQLAPVGVLETILTERVAAGFWRLQRAGRMEAEMLELMQSSDPTDPGANDPAAADLRQTAAQLKRLIESRIADSAPGQPQPVRRLPWKGFKETLAAWKATPEGQRYVYGTWPADAGYPSPEESFSAFMHKARQSADPYAYDPAFDHGPALPQDALAAAADPAFTEQTHLDASPDTPPTADPSADTAADTAADCVFTKQTHCEGCAADPPVSEYPPSDARPARSLGDVVAADLRGPNTILKLNRYEAHIERSLYKTLSELERLQQRRLARETADPEPIDTELIANA